MTDALKIIAENTAKFAGGSVPKLRYKDIMDPKPEETRSPEDIVNNIKSKLRE